MRQKPRVLFTGFTHSGELLLPAQIAMALDGRICETFLAVGRLFDNAQTRTLRQQIQDAIVDTDPSAICFLGRTTLDYISIEPCVPFLDPTTHNMNFLPSTLPVTEMAAAVRSPIPAQRRGSAMFTPNDTAMFYNGLSFSQELDIPIPAGPITLPEHAGNLSSLEVVPHFVDLIQRAAAMAIAVGQPHNVQLN